jgi:hypothetical protein
MYTRRYSMRKKLIVVLSLVGIVACARNQTGVEVMWQEHQPFIQTLPVGGGILYTADGDSTGTLCFDMWRVKAEPKMKVITVEGKQYTVPGDTLQIVPVKHLHSWVINPRDYR